MSDLAFGKLNPTARNPVDELSQFAAFSGGAYGLTTTANDVQDARNGDIVAMLGILGLVPGGAWARILATMAKGGRLLSNVLKTALAVQRAGRAPVHVAWTYGEVSPALVKAAAKQGGEAVQRLDEYGWRLEETVQSATPEVPIPGSLPGKTKEIVTSTILDEKGKPVVSGTFEGPIWPDHPINRLAGIDVGQRSRVAVLLDQVPGEKRLALEVSPKSPAPLQHSTHQGQPSPYSSSTPADLGVPDISRVLHLDPGIPAIARALHPKLAYDLTMILQGGTNSGSSAAEAAARLYEILLRFSDPKATLHGVTRPNSVRMFRNSVRPERLDIWMTSQETTTLFEILPRDMVDLATTLERFVR